MVSDKPIRVAIIGLGFGAEFIPIYQNYPGGASGDLPSTTGQGLGRELRPYGVKTSAPITANCSKTRTSTRFSRDRVTIPTF